MADLRRIINTKFAAVLGVLTDFGLPYDPDHTVVEVQTDEVEENDWLAWIGDQDDDSLHGEGATEEEALRDLDRNISKRMKEAAERLESQRQSVGEDK